MGRSLSPEVMKELRDNLAAELRELRQYPEEVTLEEARRLRSEHDKISDARSATVAAKGVKVPYAKH